MSAIQGQTGLTAETAIGRGVPGRWELVRGEIVRMSPAGFSHSAVVASVTFVLQQWAIASKRGRVLSGEAGVITERNPDTVRGADVAFVSFEQVPRGTAPTGFLDVPPELVVEVLGLDKSWRQATDKVAEYLRMGVRRVWVIDPQNRSLHAFRPDDEPVKLVGEQEVSEPVVLPGLRFALGSLFEE